MTLEISAVLDADQSARMYVCFACGWGWHYQSKMHFHPELYFLLRQKIWKNIQVDGGLIAYCLIFANPNIQQNTGKFMYFLKQAWKIDIFNILCLLLVHQNRSCINRECIASSWAVRRITENHTFTENHRKPPKTTWKIIFIGELYPPSICFLVVYVYI